jgi:hypothetical protein
MDESLRKTEAINLRMSPAVKDLLRSAAEREHRTLSNMLEVLILEHCRRNSIEASGDKVAAVSKTAPMARPRRLATAKR